MPELLLELFSEDIPARMQMQAAKDLERLIVGTFADNGLLFEAARAFAGPRRLTLVVTGLPAKQPDVKEEKKGPRVGAPQAAIDGFLKSAGVSLAQCEKKSDPKGDYYLAVTDRKGRATADVLKTLLPEAIAKLPWPKSMRWPGAMPVGAGLFEAPLGQGRFAEGTQFRWVRPLRSIICTFDGEIVSFELAGVKSGNTTWGHRFLLPGAISVKRFDDYTKKLRDAHVIVDGVERRETILEDAKQKSFALGLEVVDDEGLANEVMGLAEWPVVLVGTIAKQFMDLPPEILQTTMRTHQKYFALRDPATMKLANKFVVVANMETKDGGKEIVAGNERVLRARLADAKFFWDQDRKRTLESRLQDLEAIRFYDEYSMQRKVHGLETKAIQIAAWIGANKEKAKRAARLAKADLTTGMVGEFPELQGVIGRYYYLQEPDADRETADAIRDHYKPLGPADSLPSSAVGDAVALADKLINLYWLFLEGERPTGSKDPYALRRAALGMVRIILERQYRLSLTKLLDLGWFNATIAATNEHRQKTEQEIIDFIIDRLKVALREKVVRHDLIEAVFTLGNEDDLVRLVRRVEALQAFLKTDDGANLLTGYKRAANILKIEEKKDKKEYRGAPNAGALKDKEEKDLAAALDRAKKDASAALQKEDFAAAMSALAKLRIPVDRFFEKVTVNADDKALRENRLKLLSQIVETAHQVADFSKIEG